MAKQKPKTDLDADMLTIDGRMIDNSTPEDLEKERQVRQNRGSRNDSN